MVPSKTVTFHLLLIQLSLRMATTLPSCSSKLLSMLNGTDSYELLSAVDESVAAMCGIHGPQDCDPDEKIAILIPYRNRYSQLQILLSYLLEFLSKFRTRFAIFIIEPTDGQVFNRGKLFNIGYNLANTIENWDCFFFHDVDLLPTNRQLPYRCPRNGTVQHWSSAIDKDGFKLPYSGYIGGVSAMNTEDFLKINGYPNEFWGWGGEDDCFGYRVHGSKLEVVRAPNNTGTYTMLRHGSDEKGNEKNPCRHGLLNKWRELWNHDGLNSLKYRLISFDLYNRFYHIHVDTEPPSDICGILKNGLHANHSTSNLTSTEMASVLNFTIVDHCGSYGQFPTMTTVSNLSNGTLIILMMLVMIISFFTVHIFGKLLRISGINVGCTSTRNVLNCIKQRT